MNLFKHWKPRILFGALLVLQASWVWGAEVKITFLPPPLEGTISLGIYNKSGALVRTLFKEATAKDFVVGLNGFITQWDGKDGGGQWAPAGKYTVRGYGVGAIEVEGVAFHCNDWITEEDSPRVARLSYVNFTPEGELLIRAQEVDGKALELRCDREGAVRLAAAADLPLKSELPERETGVSEPLAIEGDHLVIKAGPPLRTLPGVEKIVASCRGHDNSVWVIDQTAAGSEVKQYSATDELLRRLAVPANQPQPFQIAAALDRELIFLLERGPNRLGLRGLALDPAAAAPHPTPEGATTAAWKVFFSRTITQSDSLGAVADCLGRDKPVVAEEKFRIRLLPNPLFQDAIHEVVVHLGIDGEGAHFLDEKGLALCSVTSTPKLKWAAMVRDSSPKILLIFQSDGAVVEEFKARKLANMMAFDAGEYDWVPPK